MCARNNTRHRAHPDIKARGGFEYNASRVSVSLVHVSLVAVGVGACCV